MNASCNSESGAARRLRALPAISASRLWTLAAFAAALCLLFSPFLIALFRYALASDLYSHVCLVPAISAWFVWTRRRRLPAVADGRLTLAAPAVLLIVVTLFAYGLYRTVGVNLNENDQLSLMMFLFVTTLLGGVCTILGSAFLRAVLFPALFLYFLVPMPDIVTHAVNVVLQHVSAWTLAGLLRLAPTPVFRDGLTFYFPGLALHVAEECSGIRSTLVLLITALVAAMLFLRTSWRRTLLVACFFPVAALRNATRILAIAMGSLYIDPEILHGPLHRKGGPPFFVLSLIPLFAIMILLRRSERKLRPEMESES